MKEITFINYRREDTGSEAKLIKSSLPSATVFIDTESVEYGDVWPERIRSALQEAHFVLVVIGSKWLTAGMNEWGQRRIDNESDWVRQEIAAALVDKEKTIIPVLVQGAKMPPPEVLPDDVAGICSKQAIEIRQNYWDHDVRLLIEKVCLNGCATGSETDYPAKVTVQPSVRLKFVYPSSPALIIENDSLALARDIKWAVVLWNQDLPDRDDPLPIPVSTFDWLKPHQEGGAQGLFGSALVSPLVNNGDRLVGTATVDCPKCDRRRNYIVSITYGEGGWFAEVPTPGLVLPRDFTRATREKYFAIIESLAPVENRRNIDYPY